MAAKFFGQYLLEKKIISENILLEATRLQKSSNQLLGVIAVTQGYINQQQVDEINLKQQTENKKFGDLARELGYINRNQLEELLGLQRKTYQYFGDVLVELKALTKKQLTQLLGAYEIEKKQAINVIYEQIKQHDLAEYLIITIETINRLFVRLLHEKSQLSEIVDMTMLLPDFKVICKVTLETQPAISISLATHSNTARIVASKFTLQPIENCDAEFAVDALGEFLNIVVGHLIEESDLTKNIERAATELNINLTQLCQSAQQILVAKIDTQIGDLLIIINN